MATITEDTDLDMAILDPYHALEMMSPRFDFKIRLIENFSHLPQWQQVLTRSVDWLPKKKLPWLQYLTSRFFPFFDPFFAWPNFTVGPRPLASEPPSCEGQDHLIPLLFSTRFTRLVHWLLMRFSFYYSSWYGYSECVEGYPLPFGLVIKLTQSFHIGQFHTIRSMRAAGIPVSKIISYADHPRLCKDRNFISVLMTRIPGRRFGCEYEKLNQKERETIDQELHTIMTTMRSWENPFGQKVCNIRGEAVVNSWIPLPRPVEVPNPEDPQTIKLDRVYKVFESEGEFVDFLLKYPVTALKQIAKRREDLIKTANKLRNTPHKMVFTFGDYLPDNIWIHNKHISGISGWDCSGWYPEYFEFRTYPEKHHCPYDMKVFFDRLGQGNYEEELGAMEAFSSLTAIRWVV